MTQRNHTATTAKIAEYLPHLRRYARAVSGDRSRGDKVTAAFL
jgi:hypothetical protein